MRPAASLSQKRGDGSDNAHSTQKPGAVMGDTVILGVFVADVAFRMGRPPHAGETVLAQSFTMGPGGKGSNQAVACAKAGGAAHMITRLGADHFADMAHQIWARAGVNAAAVKIDPGGQTGAACILLDAATGQNSIVVCPGSAADICPADLDACADLIAGAAVFVTQCEQPLSAALRGLQIARAAGVRTVLNPAPATDMSCAPMAEMLRLSDFVMPNETEAEILTGLPVATLPQAEAAARALVGAGAGAAVITLGARGALFYDGTQSVHVAAIDAGDVVDTTGAGDAFVGGFSAALSLGVVPLGALRFATATAALAVTQTGAAVAMPARDQILHLLTQVGWSLNDEQSLRGKE